MSDTSFAPSPDTRREFREALGCFGTGVTVVTTLSDRGPIAMTANSFSSVSLDPPLVLWCPAKGSERHETFITAPRYVIHVMAEDQQTLASHFARTGDDFDEIIWQSGAGGLPVLEGCLAHFLCRRTAVHDGGDHSIVLGQVERASYRTGSGLIFKRGQFGGFAGL